MPILSRYLQKNFQPYTVRPGPTLKWLLEKTNFLSFSLLFLRYTTNLRGTLALVPISTHPTVEYLEQHQVQMRSDNRVDPRVVFQEEEYHRLANCEPATHTAKKQSKPLKIQNLIILEVN
jgi:hypothetical protein